MLSILIPVYNYPVYPFVKELSRQAKATGIPFEILCYDDYSKEEIRLQNRSLSNLAGVVYKEMNQNYGRSKIRNILADEAYYDYLLFADCDSATVNYDFIQNYMDTLQSCPDNEKFVLYGGRSYHKKPPTDVQYYLNWHYGIKREQFPASERKKMPYRFFKTNNFLFPKSLLDKIKLNEALVGYGHEDTLLGLQLRWAEVPVYHIDNPLIHEGLATNEEFIKKTREGINNLAFMIQKGWITHENRLYHYYTWLKKLGLASLARLSFKPVKKWIEKRLMKNSVSLSWLDCYKLGLLLEIMAHAPDSTNS